MCLGEGERRAVIVASWIDGVNVSYWTEDLGEDFLEVVSMLIAIDVLGPVRWKVAEGWVDELALWEERWNRGMRRCLELRKCSPVVSPCPHPNSRTREPAGIEK